MIDEYNLVPIIANMVKWMLTTDPNRRPSAQDVLAEYFSPTATIQV